MQQATAQTYVEVQEILSGDTIISIALKFRSAALQSTAELPNLAKCSNVKYKAMSGKSSIYRQTQGFTCAKPPVLLLNKKTNKQTKLAIQQILAKCSNVKCKATSEKCSIYRHTQGCT